MDSMRFKCENSMERLQVRAARAPPMAGLPPIAGENSIASHPIAGAIITILERNNNNYLVQKKNMKKIVVFKKYFVMEKSI